MLSVDNTFGFIGTGNMGSALARAAAKTMSGEHIYLSNRTQSKAEALSAELGCKAVSKTELAEKCGYIFLGVKPQMMAELLSEIAPVLAQRKDFFVLVTMAAGLTMEKIRLMAGGAYPVIRIMPNTPVAVGCGVTMYAATENVPQAVLEQLRRNLSQSGLLDPLDEHLIDAGCAVAGCGPAFADLFIEALADGAVACGLPRAKAVTYAAQMLQGAARLVLESGRHPSELKDAVCSPGGSTISGVQALEQNGFRAACMAAVEAAFRRNVELGQ